MYLTISRGSLAVAVLVFTECQDPTEITLQITSDSCATLTETGIAVGSLTTFDTRTFSATQSGCARPAYVGSIVLIPSGSTDGTLGIKIVGAIGKDPATCTRADPKCIVARRALGFLPHTSLTLPIALEASCAGIACDDPTTTCVKGNCVSATVDPHACASGDCLLDGGAPDATVNTGVPVVLTSGQSSPNDIAVDATNIYWRTTATAL